MTTKACGAHIKTKPSSNLRFHLVNSAFVHPHAAGGPDRAVSVSFTLRTPPTIPFPRRAIRSIAFAQKLAYLSRLVRIETTHSVRCQRRPLHLTRAPVHLSRRGSRQRCRRPPAHGPQTTSLMAPASRMNSTQSGGRGKLLRLADARARVNLPSRAELVGTHTRA